MSGDIECVLAIGLAKQVEDRFASVSEFTAALEGAVNGHLSEDVRKRSVTILRKLPWTER
jgi:hypothetical protein